MENEQSTCIKFYSNKSKAEYHQHLVMLFREMMADATYTPQESRTTACENFRDRLGVDFLQEIRGSCISFIYVAVLSRSKTQGQNSRLFRERKEQCCASAQNSCLFSPSKILKI